MLSKSAMCAIGVVVGIAGAAQAQGLAGLWGWETGNEDLYNIGIPATMVGGAGDGIIAEIEYGGGVIYGADTDDNSRLHRIDPATGLTQSVLTMSFPTQGDVITSMEFVGGRLYAGLTTEGGGETFLSTIDLGTGVVSVVGSPTGIGSPLGGLALDPGSGRLYAASAGGSSGELFTIDIGTGVATSVGLVSLAGRNVGLTALEFGTDGRLYALPNGNQPNFGSLLEIDPNTASATDLGATGASMVALTSVPAPGSVALMGVALLASRRRRSA